MTIGNNMSNQVVDVDGDGGECVFDKGVKKAQNCISDAFDSFITLIVVEGCCTEGRFGDVLARKVFSLK
jgi:hypothetical protein